MTKIAAAVISLVLATRARAHIALWDKGMFGINWPGQITDPDQNYDNSYPVQPLEKSHNLTMEEWFAHGYKNYPPKDGDFMELPAGGQYIGETTCNRAWTTLGNPAKSAEERLIYFACPDKGSVHIGITYEDNPSPPEEHFGGTSLAIAYTSDVQNLKPSDMVVFSVNYTSVWARETIYPVPSGMPPCPSGGCLCTWNWLHKSGNGEGNPDEIYNLLYRCNVTGDTSKLNTLGQGQVPVLCENSTCVHGPKTPIYAYQLDGNNIGTYNNSPSVPPSYNGRYGFADGAQTDALVTSDTPTSKAGTGTISTTSATTGATSSVPASNGASRLTIPNVLVMAASVLVFGEACLV